MTPERWQQVKVMMDAAFPLSASERASYLATACENDLELRSEVESLLSALDQADTGFLRSSHTNGLAQVFSPLPAEGQGGSAAATQPAYAEEDLIGCRLGAYQIVERIGAGGMGEVYRAFRADDQYRKEVAIKVVRGEKASRIIRERFKNERQILAALDHPNICRLLDGGTTPDGMPYFVMELVKGQAIDEYCNSRRLPLRERLNLFLAVCSAVQYAHQRLIVHRDLKPANILVNDDGIPKLLDFGIAKILDANSAETPTATVTIFQVLTPRYASPEQIKGEPITTASDIYSLGVVFYELLVGESPYRMLSRTPHEMSQAVCQEEPLRPSTVVRRRGRAHPGEKPLSGDGQKLTKRLRGDLDNIALMALRKEASRRYSSVEQFAGDVGRHLQNLPVMARQDTFRYRTSKFVMRHRAAVIASALALLALVSGLAIALHEAHRAEQERARAERRFNDVRKLANSLLFQLHDAIKDLPGSTPARKLLVSNALEYLDRLSKEAKNDAGLQRELATAYEKIGDVQGQPRQANLGDPVGAAASYRKALVIRESLIHANPADLEVGRQLAANYGKLSDLLWATGDNAGCLEYADKAVNMAETVYRADPGNFDGRFTRALYRMDKGYKQALFGGDPNSGLADLQQASALLEQLVSERPDNLSDRRMLALSYSRAAEIMAERTGNRSKALALYQRSLSAKEALVAAEPTNAEYRRLVAYDHFDMAVLLSNMHDGASALAQDHEALASFEKLAKADPQNAQLQQDLGRVHGDIGQTLTDLGRPANALLEFQLSLAILEKLSDAHNAKSLAGYTIAVDQLVSAKDHVIMASAPGVRKTEKIQHCREAEAWLRKCLPTFEVIRDHAPPQYGGAAKVSEVKAEMDKCQRLLGETGTAARH